MVVYIYWYFLWIMSAYDFITCSKSHFFLKMNFANSHSLKNYIYINSSCYHMTYIKCVCPPCTAISAYSQLCLYLQAIFNIFHLFIHFLCITCLPLLVNTSCAKTHLLVIASHLKAQELLSLPEKLDQQWWHLSADTDEPIITTSPYKPRHKSATLLSSQMIVFWSLCWSDCVWHPCWWCRELVVLMH